MAASFIWDQCRLDQSILNAMSILNDPSHKKTNAESVWEIDPLKNISESIITESANEVSLGNQKTVLTEAESNCQLFLEELDELLAILTGISVAHSDVTGRTNNLITRCEHLLEQQHSLQTTVESLRESLIPFNDIEEISGLLGIPVDIGQAQNSSSNDNQAVSKSTTQSKQSNNSSNNTRPTLSHVVIDPRSPEFHDILRRLSSATIYFREHRHYLDSEKYTKWLEQLTMRATSLIAKSMRELLDNAGAMCKDIAKINTAKLHSQSNNKTITAGGASAGAHAGGGGGHPLHFSYSDDHSPLESAPIYQKFRGLSYRMKELNSILHWSSKFHANNKSNSSPRSKNSSTLNNNNKYNSSLSSLSSSSVNNNKSLDEEIIEGVKESYVLLRTELLLPLIREHIAYRSKTNIHSPVAPLKTSSNDSKLDKTNHHNNTTIINLCQNIRQAYSTLLRVTQLEQQLFISLFSYNPLPQSPQSTESTPTSPSHNNNNNNFPSFIDQNNTATSLAATAATLESSEVLNIVESVCNSTNDCLRPQIIHESDIDELCKVINILVEDVRSQISAMHVPKGLISCMLKSLERTMNDAQERLVYCAEIRLRQDVQLFQALPSQLSYPDIIENYYQTCASITLNNNSETNEKSIEMQNSNNPHDDISMTWFPPLQNTLALLSKLYGIVEMAVFEDFAMRSVASCVAALSSGANGVRKCRSSLNGDLFLIRHLIVLREQLSPFEIRLQGIERRLDFRPTTSALFHFQNLLIQNTRSMLRFDSSNSLLQLAVEGLPGIEEQQMDAKMELDHVLRNACMSLKQSAIKAILGPLDGFLAKCSAFVGDIPFVSDETQGIGHSRNGFSSSSTSSSFVGGENEKQVLMLQPDLRVLLKNQSFVKPDRIKEVVLNLQETSLQNTPEFRSLLKLYIESSVARSVLLKPIQLEIEVAKLRMECILASCVDPGQPKRDLEQLLKSTIVAIVSEISK